MLHKLDKIENDNGAPGCPNQSTENKDVSFHQLSMEKKEKKTTKEMAA